MKTILVDAINGLILEDGTIFREMYDLLESYPNKKIILTGANDEQFKKFKLDQAPYDVFTLKHNPEKTNPEYYKILLNKYSLDANNVVYFEHSKDAVESARSIGVITYFYNHLDADLVKLKEFLDRNLNN